MSKIQKNTKMMMQTCFTKRREQNLARRNGKNSLDSFRIKNFMDYNSLNDFTFYISGQVYQ